MEKRIVTCDKCGDIQGKVMFKIVNISVSSDYISQQIHLCPDHFKDLNFCLKLPVSGEPDIGQKLYDFIYEIAADAVRNVAE